MDSSSLSTTTSQGSSNLDALPISLHLAQPDPGSAPDFAIVVDILRQALASGARSTDSILRAAADAARVLSGADGAAVALRKGARIVCRARSGNIAPELGAPLNADSGISGECLRAATILVCNDAATDTRVDPEVCLTLGVRSIVVVPLRGAMGIAGILEAFATRPGAFGVEQIDSLRALAEIAETAYEHEFRFQSAAKVVLTPAARITTLLLPPMVKEHAVKEAIQARALDEFRPRRRYWIAGLVAIALILVSLIVWFTWREPVAEIVAREAPAQPINVNAPEGASDHPAPRVVALKPEAGVVSRDSRRPKSKDALEQAARIEVLRGAQTPASTDMSLTPPTTKEAAALKLAINEPPPSVEVRPSTSAEKLATLSSVPAVLPAFGARVSSGVTKANLLHKVDPIYPPEARLQQLAGLVVLDATVAEDGSVHEVKLLGGPPLLATAATEAVRQWRYRPSMLNGKPVPVQERITIIFKLPRD